MRTLILMLLITTALTAYYSQVYYPPKGMYYHMPTHGYQVKLEEKRKKEDAKLPATTTHK